MALPILAMAGIGAATAFFQSVFKEVITFLFTKGFKRLVYFAAFATAIYAAISLFYSSVSGYLASVLSGMPSEIQMIGYVLPSNTGTCITALIGLEVAGLTYAFAMDVIKVKMASVS